MSRSKVLTRKNLKTKKFITKDYTFNVESIIYKRHIYILIIDIGKKKLYLHGLRFFLVQGCLKSSFLRSLPVQQQSPCSPNHHVLNRQSIEGRVSGLCPTHHDNLHLRYGILHERTLDCWICKPMCYQLDHLIEKLIFYSLP